MRQNITLHGQEYPRRPLFTHHHQVLVEDGLQSPRFAPPIPSLPALSSSSPYAPSPSTSSSHHSSRRGNSSSASSSRKRSREDASRAAPIGGPSVAKPLVLSDLADEERVAEKENSRHGANAPPSQDSVPRNEKEKEEREQGGGEEEEKDECCICLGEIGEVMGCLTCCEHKFCFGCISQWAEKSNTCPLCKQRFREIIKKTAGGQPQGRKKRKTERVRVRRKDYNPWSEEEDEDDSDDDDLDDEDFHWPPPGFLIDSFSVGSMHAPPFYSHHAHHAHHHHAHQHSSGFPSFSFVTQPTHVHHAMGLFDMFHRLMFDTTRSSYAPHGHGHGHSTYASSSSSGDEPLSEPDSPEVILVDSDGEDTSSLERGRTRREQRTAAADIPEPLALPRPRLPATQEVIDLTLLPDSEGDDDGDGDEADVARRLRRGQEPGAPLPAVVVNLEESPVPQMREFARRSGGRIADIIHEQDI